MGPRRGRLVRGPARGHVDLLPGPRARAPAFALLGVYFSGNVGLGGLQLQTFAGWGSIHSNATASPAPRCTPPSQKPPPGADGGTAATHTPLAR